MIAIGTIMVAAYTMDDGKLNIVAWSIVAALGAYLTGNVVSQKKHDGFESEY